MSGSPLGSGLAALDSGGLKPINYLNSIHRFDKEVVPEFAAQGRDVFNASFPQFQADNLAARNAMAALRPQTLADMNRLTGNLIGADPFAQYQNTLNAGMAAGDRATANLGDLTSSTAKANIQALGGGGRPMGSAALARINQDVAQSMLPIFNNIISGAGATTTGLSAAQRANAGSAMNAIDYRAGVPMQGYGLALDPISALAAAQVSRFAGPQAATKTEAMNTTGWQSDPGTLGKIGNAMNATANSMTGLLSNVGEASGQATDSY